MPTPDDLRPQRRAPEEDQGGQKNRAEANAYHRGVDHPQCAAQQGDQGEKAGKHAQAQIETDLPIVPYPAQIHPYFPHLNAMGRAPIEARPIAGFLDSPWQHIVNAKVNHNLLLQPSEQLKQPNMGMA